MRIVSGTYKGRSISAPPGRDTRPTSDRARESIFNILQHGVPGPGLKHAHIADIFAGTGALGLEALSRGAAHCTFIENNSKTVRTLRENIQTLDVAKSSTLMTTPAAAIPPPKNKAMDYVFMDAPYHQELSLPALRALMENKWLKEGCILMVEVAKDEPLDPPPNFTVLKEKQNGAARMVFLMYADGNTLTPPE